MTLIPHGAPVEPVPISIDRIRAGDFVRLHDARVEYVRAGQRIALNLGGVTTEVMIGAIADRTSREFKAGDKVRPKYGHGGAASKRFVIAATGRALWLKKDGQSDEDGLVFPIGDYEADD
ncbi:MAG TPA: hypothetical protein VEF90_17750 [Xanthobacteraceae bacterium]|nr:hypothetical protein [Xanthobacteraceae bacterium]